ncbi:MAG: hypothetical protein U0X20_13945 [Caldilineaceae bacterium]
MNDNQNFAIEQIEDRLETLWVLVPYVGTCYKCVWFVCFPFLCLKWRWIWV